MSIWVCAPPLKWSTMGDSSILQCMMLHWRLLTLKRGSWLIWPTYWRLAPTVSKESFQKLRRILTGGSLILDSSFTPHPSSQPWPLQLLSSSAIICINKLSLFLIFDHAVLFHYGILCQITIVSLSFLTLLSKGIWSNSQSATHAYLSYSLSSLISLFSIL